MQTIKLNIDNNRNLFNNKNAEKAAIINKQNDTMRKVTAAKTWISSLNKSVQQL